MTQTRRVLPDRPRQSLSDHLAAGGGGGLAAALDLAPADIVAAVDRSGLRGRGGAGFPTGRKWSTVMANASPAESTTVVVNAAEGEPGTFKDRQILRTDPYLVIEGALIAAHAVGARRVVIATKASFTHERARLAAAIGEVRAEGWADGLRIDIVEGPSEYLFGEETAMLEVVEGRPPLPRVAPPYRRGLDDPAPSGHSGAGDVDLAVAGGSDAAPALVDNVETLANVALVLRHGPEWFRGVGTDASPGTIVCTITGATVRHGVGEFAMGTPLAEVIEELGGGARSKRRLVAALPGVSGPVVAAADFDVPLTYEALDARGSGLGSAGFIVIDDATSLRTVAAEVARFLAIESCGQCEPCKRDGLAIRAELAPGHPTDRAAVAERLRTVADGARCALAGQTERVVGSLVALDAMAGAPAPAPVAPGEDRGPLVLPIVDLVDERARLDTGHLAKQPDWSTAEIDSGAWPAQLLADQPVEVSSTRSAEGPGAEPVAPAGPPPGLFDSLLAMHRSIAAQVERVRAADPVDRAPAAGALAGLLAEHLQVTQRFLYPAVRRADDDLGGDVAFYPEEHERSAQRLTERVRSTDHQADGQVVDDLAEEVDRYVDEIEVRLLPLVCERTDPHDLAELGAGVDDLLVQYTGPTRV